MTAALIMPYLLISAVLVLIAAMRPQRSKLSYFELSRRADKGGKRDKATLKREQLIGDVISLQRAVLTVLVVLLAAVGALAFQWALGLLFSVVVALLVGTVIKWPFLRNQANQLYELIEPSLLITVEKVPIFSSSDISLADTGRLESREELVHLISQSDGLLSDSEKKFITSSLSFESKPLSDVMTPRSMIDSISKKELLGPLVLDDLHKTGHSRFPVTDSDIDHVVGMLFIHDLLTLDNGRRSTTVEKAMEPQVFYIHQDQTLHHALAAFIRTHHHLFIVINEFRETVGILSLEDVIEALIGRKIIDEFDAHTDPRSVAARNPRDNNHPANETNV